MNTTRRIVATTAAALGAGALLAPAVVAEPSTDSLDPAPETCAVDTAEVAATTSHPEGAPAWTAGASADLCGNLGYLVLETPGGTGSSPGKVLLFHRGAPTKTQPAEAAAATAGSHSPFHVAVSGKQAPAAGQANVDAPSSTTVYVWNPAVSDVVPVGPLPGQLGS